MRQLYFSFATQRSYLGKEFFVCPANHHAFGWSQFWPKHQPSTYFSAFYGPPKSGKTHLLHHWCEQNHGVLIQHHETKKHDPFSLMQQYETATCFGIDDAKEVDDLWMLHWYNLLKEAKKFLLVTALLPTTAWCVSTPDWSSRLHTFQNIQLHEVESDYLAAFVIFLFQQHGVSVDAHVANYLVQRIERCYESVHGWVQYLNLLSVERARPLTIPFIKSVLE
jgi:chromosomal replication initiation ATPase DnaA